MAPVPQGRARRFLHLGFAVGELFASAAAHGLTRLSRGEPIPLQQLLFVPANARRLAGRLSTMRGAVMKVGQLMSMDANGVLPAEFGPTTAPRRVRSPTIAISWVKTRCWSCRRWSMNIAPTIFWPPGSRPVVPSPA